MSSSLRHADALSTSQRLLLAAATTRRDQATSHAVRALAADADWVTLTQLALEHAVVVPVFRTLAAFADDLVPEDVAAAAITFEADQHARNERLADELAAILTALNAAGIPAVPFKGPLLALEAYGDLALRRFRDLDFMVREADIDACYAVLAGLDYRGKHELSPAQERAFRAYAGEDILFQRERGVAIEPHWAFAPHTLAIDVDYDGLWQRMRPTTFRGVEILALSPEDTVLALAIHGGKEQWVRLQWICDFAQTVRNGSALDWRAVVARATSQGCLRHLAVALWISHALLDLEIPVQVAGLFARDPASITIATGLIDRLFAADNEPPSIYTVTCLRLRLRERWRDRLAYAWRTVTTPRTIHFEMLRLPDPLIALYRPAKLAHDYLLLPIWWRLYPPSAT